MLTTARPLFSWRFAGVADQGFTLIELMVVLALVALFALIGIPSYRSVTTRNRMAAEMNALVGDLQYARSEAIKRGHDVDVCATDAQSAPDCLGANATQWSGGWVVYAPAFAGNITHVLRVQAALQGHDTLATNAASNPGVIAFNRNGFAPGVQQTFVLNDAAGAAQQRRCAVLSTVGGISIRTAGEPSCP
ncbi:MAG: GspH/FimT family pseudopilin [Acidihalobacter sp.]